MNKTYSEMLKLKTFLERFQYLQLSGNVGDITFGGHRMLNQMLYQCREWKDIRRRIIIRDEGMDLAHQDHPVMLKIIVHHINPITIDDILERRYKVFDPENLVCTSQSTHNALHYGYENELLIPGNNFIERARNDTCPWR